jgi:acylphosphatase
MTATHLLITGRVQGVGYRDWLIAEARRLGLNGWVRNAGGDTVEALLAGAPERVEACVRACWRGPALAVVETITATEAAAPAEPGFLRRNSLPDRP